MVWSLWRLDFKPCACVWVGGEISRGCGLGGLALQGYHWDFGRVVSLPLVGVHGCEALGC